VLREPQHRHRDRRSRSSTKRVRDHSPARPQAGTAPPGFFWGSPAVFAAQEFAREIVAPLQQVAADPEWQPPNLDRGPLGRCVTCRGRIHWAYQNRPTEEGPQHSICLLAEDLLGKVYEFAASDPPQVGYLFIESLLRWATSFVQLVSLFLFFF